MPSKGWQRLAINNVLGVQVISRPIVAHLMSLWVLAIVSVASAIPSSASETPGNGAVRCQAIVAENFSGVEDAPTHITDARPVDASEANRRYCVIRGYIAPQVGFELRLPSAGWNGKLIEVGCGGFCGSIEADACADPLRRGYACIASDMGHRGEDGLWAYNNLPAKIDWAYRGPHVVAIVGKVITERFYQQAPKKSYFSGCSTGGRLGMVEAQRFPWDFDGIIAGAPPLSFTGNSMAQLSAAMAATGDGQTAVLNPVAVALVHNAVLAKCDLDDGVRDGIVSNPLGCAFDPRTLVCRSDHDTDCLTAEQANAINRIYRGIPEVAGGIDGMGFTRGSELNWRDVFFGSNGAQGFLYSYATQKFRYAIFWPDAGPRWNPSNLDVARDAKRLGTMESLYSAANPDLRAFKRKGGKLLVYQGWNDPIEPPAQITDYYQTVERLIGTRSATQGFFRLFMIPGMGHCGGGEGAWLVDYLAYLDDWVEQGKAPDKLIGGHVKLPNDPTKAQQLLRSLTFPLRASDLAFSRPVFPYPQFARYSGHGSIDDAAIFVPTESKVPK